MFTGLIQKTTTIRYITDDGHGGRQLVLDAVRFDSPLEMGESIAVNGVCLSVVRFDANELAFDIGPETVHRTTFSQLQTADRVHLERSLRVGDRLGGHIVTGHVDCVGMIHQREQQGDWQKVWFRFDGPRFDDLVVIKGSLAVDGVSLTLVDVEPGLCSVMLIPHTIENTTLGHKPIGAGVNLEFDLIAKHVQKMFHNLTIEL